MCVATAPASPRVSPPRRLPARCASAPSVPPRRLPHFFIDPKPASSAKDSVQQFVLFYFSRSEGICESDDYDALPVVCTLRPDKTMQQVRAFSRHPKRLAFFSKHNFQYRLPSLAQMKLSCELFDYQVTLPVAQFGPVVDLPHRHFKALFDPTTGAIVYFEN